MFVHDAKGYPLRAHGVTCAVGCVPLSGLVPRPGLEPLMTQPDPSGTHHRESADLRTTVPCDRLGFRRPPADLHVRLLPFSDRWRLFVWQGDGQLEGVDAWVGEHTEASLQRQIRKRLTVYDIPDLPEAWGWWQSPFEVLGLTLNRTGEANLLLDGPEEALRSFAAGLGVPGAAPADGHQESYVLTEKQHKAIAVAIAEGYFEVPRKIRLADLAERIGTSVGGLSELLRRAESSLLEAYIEATPSAGSALSAGPASGWPRSAI